MNKLDNNTEVKKEYTDIEVYKLNNGILHDHFEDFEYKYNENRIYCAKMTKEGEKQYIRWSSNNGYNLKGVKRGDILMLQKMEARKTREIDHIFYNVISRTKDKLVCQWANDDGAFTTYLKVLKAPLPSANEIEEFNFNLNNTDS